MRNTTKIMRNWQIETADIQTVAVLLFPRFSNHCLANAVEPLRAANEKLMRIAYRWEIVTLDGEAVESSSGLPVLPACRLSDHPGGDFLFVMSSYDARRHASPRTSRALKSAAKRFPTLIGMDTGSWLMAEAELLDGLRATIHWDEFTAFSETFPDVRSVTDRVVAEPGRWSCGGAMTAFDLVLHLIRETHGEAVRLEVASVFLFQNTQPSQDLIFRRFGSDIVERAVTLMSSNLETPVPVGDIAGMLEISPRNLMRAFRNDLGAPPQTVYKRLRLMAARRYVEQSGYSIAEIALRCGYLNAAAMTRAFKDEFGIAPSRLRRRTF